MTFDLLQQMPEDISLVPSSHTNEQQKCIQPAAKAIKIEGEEAITNTSAADDIWITYNRNTLKQSDKRL